VGPASPVHHQCQRRIVRPACLLCRRLTIMTGSGSDQSSQFDCLALEHLSRSWREIELNPNEMRTAHSQTNRRQQEDNQRLEVQDTVHATNTSQRRNSLIRTSRIPGCQFDLPVRRNPVIGGLSNARFPEFDSICSSEDMAGPSSKSQVRWWGCHE